MQHRSARSLPFRLLAVATLGCALATTGCKQIGLAPDEPDPRSVEEDPTLRQERKVTVQHVLVSFDEAGAGSATRSRDEARKLAEKVIDQARRGHPFHDLVYLYSDDRGAGAPKDGRYVISNFGVDAGPGEFERVGLVRGFGDAAFDLRPGELALVAYDKEHSPYGWHVVKRID